MSLVKGAEVWGKKLGASGMIAVLLAQRKMLKPSGSERSLINFLNAAHKCISLKYVKNYLSRGTGLGASSASLPSAVVHFEWPI